MMGIVCFFFSTVSIMVVTNAVVNKRLVTHCKYLFLKESNYISGKIFLR